MGGFIAGLTNALGDPTLTDRANQEWQQRQAFRGQMGQDTMKTFDQAIQGILSNPKYTDEERKGLLRNAQALKLQAMTPYVGRQEIQRILASSPDLALFKAQTGTVPGQAATPISGGGNDIQQLAAMTPQVSPQEMQRLGVNPEQTERPEGTDFSQIPNVQPAPIQEAAAKGPTQVSLTPPTTADVLASGAPTNMFIPVTRPDGTTFMVPAKMAMPYLTQDLRNAGAMGRTQATLNSRESEGKENRESKETQTNQKIESNEKIAQDKLAASGMRPTEIQLVMRAQNGDREAQKTLDTLQQRKLALATAGGMARGKAYGYYRVGMYNDPALGRTVPMFQGDAMQAINEGKNLVPSGPISSTLLVTAQRLSSEALPAIDGAREYLAAYDNPNDRAIYARILRDTPMDSGNPEGWMAHVLNQAMTSGLSEQGRNLAIKLTRLNETMGLMRGMMGLPATNSATALSLRMLPGASTPDSRFAASQLNELQNVITQGLGVPIIGGTLPPPNAMTTQQGGNQGGGNFKVQKSSKGNYRYSTDGGKTWVLGRPPNQK